VDDLKSQFNKSIEEINKQLDTFILSALTNTGNHMENLAKGIIEESGAYGAGRLKNSITSKVEKSNGPLLIFGAFAKSKTGYPYPSIIEYGRAPGKMPPSSVIEEWLDEKMKNGHMRIIDTTLKKGSQTRRKNTFKKKGLSYREGNTKSIAFLIARAIGQKGMKEKPFMTPAFNKSVAELDIKLNSMEIH